MRGLPADELLRLPIRFNEIELGRPVDMMLDLSGPRAVGLEVVCRDDVRRFLPLAVATVGDEAIAIGSPLLLLDELELQFYREEAKTLRALRGTTVAKRGETAGVLRDVVLGEGGRIDELVLEGAGGTRRVSLDGLELSAVP